MRLGTTTTWLSPWCPSTLGSRTRAVRLFRDKPRLSLVMHGNNHVKWELSRPATREAAMHLATEALRRIERFEQRYGLRVSRVMVPPHERCSVLMLEALLHSGYDAVCFAHGVDHDDALIDWHPADVGVAGGLPAMHREPLFCSADEMTLRAFLDKPLLLYGHHSDLGSNLDLLEEAAAKVNSVGDVTWLSVDKIVETNFASRVEDGVLWLRPFTRRMMIRVPLGVTHIAVEHTDGITPWRRTSVSSPDVVQTTATVSDLRVPHPTHGAAEVALKLVDEVAVSSSRPGLSVWPSIRRFLTEGRDRLLPLLGR